MRISIVATMTCIAALSSGCTPAEAGAHAGGPGNESSDQGGEKKDGNITSGVDLNKMAARELPPGSKKALPKGELSGEVEAVAIPTVTDEKNMKHITFSMGTDGPVECFVYDDTFDVGSGLLAVVQTAMSKNVTLQQLRPIDVVPVGDDVAVFLEAQYTVKHNGADALGMLKLVGVSSLSKPLMCFHDEVGYWSTFKRVTTGLAATLKVGNGAAVVPKYVSIAVQRVNGHPVGFVKDIEYVGVDGAVLFATMSTALTPRSPKELIAEDTGETQKWDGHGGITEIHTIQGHSGEIAEDMTIKKVGLREYSYEGSHLGKKLSGRFKTKNPGGLRTEAEEHAAIASLVASKPEAAELRFEKYMPDLDPTASLEEVFHVVSKADRRVSVSMGQDQMNIILDDKGMASKGEVAIGGATMTFDRVVLRGNQ